MRGSVGCGEIGTRPAAGARICHTVLRDSPQAASGQSVTLTRRGLQARARTGGLRPARSRGAIGLVFLSLARRKLVRQSQAERGGYGRAVTFGRTGALGKRELSDCFTPTSSHIS